MAYGGSNNIVTFGGADINRVDGNQTWTWTAAAGWQASAASAPPARRTHVMGHDPLRNRVVMFGGVAGSSFLTDTWEWNGTSWTQTQSGPPGRKGSALYFNPDLGQMNLYGNSTQTTREDLWEYGSTGWTQRSIDLPPTQNYRGATAYDAARHEALLFGGRSFTNQTRRIRYRTNTTSEACTFSTMDYDLDGAAGCADPDCWSVCTPMCPPGSPASCATTVSPRCGNGTCDPLEDCDICPSDCTSSCPAVLCGDFRCNGAETRTSCPSDCP
jgi:hypothetical protein